ncbi:DUF4157 domain-containing protein [Nostoc sp. UHCC 0926]|uniref:eCIS core domain-containing protein n=1 Tax=unclassified Nostoc TaxID=2593658 RepID=UPI00236118A6|nr:DUF4157 domain-containing protein [Nostoc sp. UHCC 0926]WDD33717.1 DUF4157 domain-containing protein [Nostoc sp. UHCC 0926]
MHNKRLSKTPSSINSNSQAAEQNPKLAYRPFGSQIQKASVAPVTQSTKEDVAFAEQKMEAFGLELQAKYGKITPEGQERLTVLQAKMDGLLNSQLQHARRFSHNIANIPLRRPDTPIQAKLTIGEPGDKYEQEADETARQVVQRIHQPQNDKLQRESLPDEEDELQMKPLGNIQRESLPDEEELQMKPMVQRRVSHGDMAATQDLEASINQARGGGQPLAKNIREPMEQGFGADFSRVKVHTDTQADQLNRSIQAKAFTTGQDVFFRQGAYEPGSRGGQELIAHELTHVVQQTNGRSVQKMIQRMNTDKDRVEGKNSMRPAFPPVSTDDQFGKSPISPEDVNKIEQALQKHVDSQIKESESMLLIITLGAQNKGGRGNPTLDAPESLSLRQEKPGFIEEARKRFAKVVSLQFDPGVVEEEDLKDNVLRVVINAAFPLSEVSKGSKEMEVKDSLSKRVNNIKNLSGGGGFILINTITSSFYPALVEIMKEAMPERKQKEGEQDGDFVPYQAAYINSYFEKDQGKFKVHIPLPKHSLTFDGTFKELNKLDQVRATVKAAKTARESDDII